MARLGLRQSANRSVRAPALKAAALATSGGRVPDACEVSRLFGEFESLRTQRMYMPTNTNGSDLMIKMTL